MALKVDPEFEGMVNMLFRGKRTRPQLAPDDWRTRRATADEFFIAISQALPVSKPVATTDHVINGYQDELVPVRIYRPVEQAESGALVIYIHGGGMFCCSLATHDRLVQHYVAETNTTFLAVDFRFAPENPFPASVEDIYSALVWANQHANELGISPDRIALAGDSAGGGMAAAVSIMTRDRQGPPVALQMLLYPMLDDRNTIPDPELEAFVPWAYDDNSLGWSLLLGETAGQRGVSPWASPARETNYSGLAPAYLEVGSLDIFRDETMRYAADLLRAGTPAELHLHNSVTHGYDMLAPQSAISRRAFSDRYRTIRAL
jgi:acetyl esterase/lipase